MKHVQSVLCPLTHAQHRRSLITSVLVVAALLAAVPTRSSAAVPDPVLEWIGIMNTAVLAGGSSPLVSTRVVALVSGSVFDAVNGINPRYKPLHVVPRAAAGSSQRAAAVQAAYSMLIKIYPTQLATLTAQRDASIALIKTVDSATSVAAGVRWGQTVANSIWEWRLLDGFTPAPPPFLGVASIVGTTAAVGAWRPTPLVGASGAAPQFASMTPWALTRPGQFRLPPPFGVTTPEYLADYNETRIMGAFSGAPRSSDQSELALFWTGNSALYWNRIALQVATARSLSLAQNAHLFALLNVAMADAAIACWDSKYRYVFWRPISAVRDSASTDSDPTWTPWLDFFPSGTPAHPEYPSGHSTVSGAAAYILAARFGDSTAVTVTSEIRSGTRNFPSFSAVVAEIADARVFGGIHFRTSCLRGNLLGQAVAHYVSTHAMR
jgi:membrane-associated phospholipid phosphatase